MSDKQKLIVAKRTQLTKADMSALWAAIEWMALCLRQPNSDSFEPEGLAAERERLATARRAYRKVLAIRKAQPK